MSITIIEAIDQHISELRAARAILVSSTDVLSKPGFPAKGRRGRPRSVKNEIAAPVKQKRVLSEEGKARIAAAQKKRWAAKKRAAKKEATELAG